MRRFDSHAKKIFDLRNDLESSLESEGKKQLLDEIITEVNKDTKDKVYHDIDRTFKVAFSVALTVVFITLNFFVVYLITTILENDITQIYLDPKYKPIIDQKVIIALVTGVIAETALAFGLLARYVFKIDTKNKKEEPKK